MSDEVWHARGCDRIGEIGGYRLRFDPKRGPLLACCDRVIDGTRDDSEARGIGVDDDVLRIDRPFAWLHVEHPEYAEADRQAQQDRLDGWAASIMAIPDAATRRAVSDSLMNHMIKHGVVP